MSLINVNEQIEKEARRVAAAFNVESFRLREEGWQTIYAGQAGPMQVWWGVDTSTRKVDYVTVGDELSNVMLLEVWSINYEKTWSLNLQPRFHHQLAQGLYRLGIEDETVLANLNAPLSAHEQLELRHSFPREFWPQNWLAGA